MVIVEVIFMDTSGVKEVLQMYFDGCAGGDAEKIAKVFHDGSHVYGLSENGKILDSDKDAFVKIIGSFKPDGQTPRQDEILSIDFTGENTAVARVKIRVGNILFTDILSFIQLEGKWGVISKVYSGVPAE